MNTYRWVRETHFRHFASVRNANIIETYHFHDTNQNYFQYALDSFGGSGI